MYREIKATIVLVKYFLKHVREFTYFYPCHENNKQEKFSVNLHAFVGSHTNTLQYT